MKCPTCGIKGVLIETRKAPDNQTMRRYWCTSLHKWKTLEVLDIIYTDEGIHANRVEQGHRMLAAKKAMYATPK